MIIYQETKGRFIDDVDHNVIKTRLVDSFLAKTGSVPSDERVWAEEYSRFSLALRKSGVDDDIQVAIEYHISAAGRFRVDVLLAGSDGETDNGMIIELKAWNAAEATDYEDIVYSPVAGGTHAQHPCVQAAKYKGLILRFNQDIRDQSIGLHSAAYLFNLVRRRPEPLEDNRYQRALQNSQLFLADDVDELCRFMRRVVPRRPKKDVIFLIENGRMLPAPELISRVSSMLEGNEEFDLIDEQNEAFQIIRHQVTSLKDHACRHVFVVEGGPGTGKSVIAVRLLAEILKAKRMGFFVAPNKAFRDTLIEFLARGNRGYREDGKALIQSSWSFHNFDYLKDHRNEVLIVDEAHRLKDQAYRYAGRSMVEDMVRAARISVFFIDETQRVSWNDTGSVENIRKAAVKYGAKYHTPFVLHAQYRCNGSTGYLNWLDDVLQIRQTANFENWGDGQYDFRVFDCAEDLYAALKFRNGNNRARLIAGYSWDWPKGRDRERGTKAKHVEADRLSLPWNYNGENWATSADGIEQVGCIHTSQGVEFDWIGVLIGPDLFCRDGQVVGDPAKRARTDASLNGWKREMERANGDSEKERVVLAKVQSIIKSTYKVLLSRGRKGCYVWCADVELRNYLKSRLTLASAPQAIIPFENALPLLNLRAAADAFYTSIDGYFADEATYSWQRIKGGPYARDRFLVRAEGDSMEPLIRDGALCLFRRDPGGSRKGKIVLCRIGGFAGEAAVALIKRYQSARARVSEGVGEAKAIVLSSLNEKHEDIVFTEGDNLSILGIFERVVEECDVA